MSSTDLAAAAPDAGALEAATRNLAELFRHVAGLFTCGDSSLSQNEAHELMESVLFVLGIEAVDDPQSIALLSRDDLPDEFRRRKAALDARAREVTALWEELVATMPPFKNIALRDTLVSIEGFPRRYDTLFAAHEIPCSIDYPLSTPVPDGLKGVDYVEAWLAQALAEAWELAQLDFDEAVRRLDAACPDPKGLHVNLRDLLR